MAYVLKTSKHGEERWLGELAERLKKKDYRPEAVKRVWIPKPNGKLRPLGIPTITDRVVQTAAMLVLEPIFEADLQPEQYAYRAERGAQDAVQAVHRLLNTGHQQVIDADLSGYFDSIPHPELMKSVARRIVDRHVLHLIKQWLDAPVEEDDGHGHRKRTTSNRDTGRGTPQGAPISPLLSNLYMRRFILGWKTLGYARRWSAQIVNYADDFVICCKGRAEDAMAAMRGMMEQLKLTVNDDKTHLCQIPQERFDFLGYTFGRCYSQKTGRAYIGTRPSPKSVKRMVESITQETDRRRTILDAEFVVGRLNRKLIGWANYFCLGSVSPAYRAINTHVTQRLRRWLCKKHKVSGTGWARYPNQYLYEKLGLVNLPARTHDLPWAKSMMSCPRAGCGKSARPVR
ncbi:group II intron reverse transcriptase/maturase [Candidatus Accumulibacter contiguus]|jgi:RNA-directed DNA polymerase|uniref:group II intron reverse transcriptase/maturase n=1 Tax=Candidatus Accumulibacter contiguus TaxID=2954381 RepID=UPI002FC3C5FC